MGKHAKSFEVATREEKETPNPLLEPSVGMATLAPPPLVLSDSKESGDKEKKDSGSEKDGGGETAPVHADPPGAPEEPSGNPANSRSSSPLRGGDASGNTPFRPKGIPIKHSEKQNIAAAQPLGVKGAGGGFSAEKAGDLLGEVGNQKPVDLVKNLTQAGPKLTEIREKEKQEVREKLPPMAAPTGLPFQGAKSEKVKEPFDPKQVELEAPSGANENPQQEITHKVSPIPGGQEMGPDPSPTALENRGSFFAYIRALPTSEPGLNSSPGTPPQLKLSGDIDPGQNQTAHDSAEADLQAEKSQADQLVQQDFGEHEMFPTREPEMLEKEIEVSEIPDWSGELETVGELEPETIGPLNEQVSARHQAEIDTEVNKGKEAQTEYELKSEEEHQKGLAEIDTETERVKAEQTSLQEQGKSDIDAGRKEWEAENQKIRDEFTAESESKRQEIDGKINQEAQKTNQNVKTEYKRANDKAKSEEKKASQAAAREKREAEQKKEKPGFWDRVKSGVKGFFKKLKQAVNAIFDKLRSLVKQIIEAAKKLANSLIDAARNLVKGLIKQFAELVKKFLRKALAAFPGVADKFCALIDKAVERTLSAIDKLADGLKKIVSAVLDLIGKAIDAYLAFYQAAINLALDVLEKICIGLIEIMEGISNLVKAAKQMPDFFLGQVSEELIGTDVTQPLENEYLPGEIAGGMAEEVASDMDVVQGEVDSVVESVPDEALEMEGKSLDEALLSKDVYSESDFAVAPIMQTADFSPELLEHFSEMKEGEFEFGEEFGSPNGLEEIKAELSGGAPEEVAGLEEMEAGGEIESPQQESVAPAAPMQYEVDPNRDIFTPDANGKIGPFTVAQRIKSVTQPIIDGVKNWLAENWPKLLLGAIAAITGLILANILTGGAIMAALPILMQLVSAAFAAEAVVNMGSHLGGYLGSAWPGEIAAGAKRLARALAIGAIELVFTLLFGGKAAVKSVKAGVKTVAKSGVKGLAKSGVKAAKGGVKNTVKNVKQLGKIGKNGAKAAGKNIAKGGKAVIKNGKFLLKGMKKGATKGAKTLKGLGKKLGKNFRFKKFKVRIKQRKFKLFGKMNPWVLLANGDIKHVKNDELVGSGQKGVGHKGKLKSNPDGEEVIVIGRNSSKKGDELTGSKYVEKFRKDKDAAGDLYNDLASMEGKGARSGKINKGEALDAKELKAIYGEKVGGTIAQRHTLAKNMGPKPKPTKSNLKGVDSAHLDDWNAHHVIPVEAIKESDLLREAIEQGFDFNGPGNGKWVKRYSSAIKKNKKTGKIIASPEGIHASHDAYNKNIIKQLKNLEEAGVDFADARKLVEDLVEDKSREIDNLLKKNDEIIQQALKNGEAIDDVLGNLDKINDL